MSMTKPVLLLVDDEARITRSLSMLFRSEFEVIATDNGHTAIDIARNQRVDVVISDQRMPILSGVEVLRGIREVSPNTMRLLLTGYADLAAVIGSVNEGEIFRFLQKPWDVEQIRADVRAAAQVAELSFAAAQRRERGEVPSEAPAATPGILLLDQDPLAHELVKRATPAGNPLFWARNLDEAMELLAQNRIGVLVTDVQDGYSSHVGAIKALKQAHPQLVTIVLTQLRDYELLVELINQGQVFRFHPKPGHVGTFVKNMQSALDYHEVLQAQPELRQRHQVAKSVKPVLAGLSDRVMGYFRRFGLSS
ncbi:response regulator [Halothiobacillus sp. DCM-1]|uniref:response regulator n=1 Tax=Halothiobacillus sp. DCM-1 TaxID=3112558 RepID=UPI00324E6004